MQNTNYDLRMFKKFKMKVHDSVSLPTLASKNDEEIVHQKTNNLQPCDHRVSDLGMDDVYCSAK